MDTVQMGRHGNLVVGKAMRQFITEENIMSEEKNGDWYVEGIFLQGDVLNNNKRVYPTDILKNSIKEYEQNYIRKNRAFGECGHPDSPKINLERVCMITEQLIQKGNNFYGRGRIVHEDHPMGKVVRGLLKSGAKLGVSSRGLGSANTSTWQEDDCDMVDHFVLRAIDIVSDPSAPDAMVEAIQEEKQYILDDSSGSVVELNEETYKIFEHNLKTLPKRQDDKHEKLYESIKNFLNSLKSNPK